MMDCEVLKIGLEKWEKLWRDIDSRIDVNKFYSLPSLADYYFKINSCFEDCYQMCGSLGQFFDNFVVGGRTMTCEDAQEFQDIEFEILDGYYFDEGFLYTD